MTALLQPRDAGAAPAPRTGRRGLLRRRPRRRRIVVLAIQLALLAALIGLWQLLAQTKTIDITFYGEPTGVWDQLKSWITSGTTAGSLWSQIWVTLQETLYGFGIGVGAGVTCGILLGRVPILAEILGVYIGTMNSIPRIVLGSLFIIWFGLGISSKVALAALLVFFSVFFNAFQGAREVDESLIANAHVLGASRLAVTLQVVVPSAFSWIIASLRVAFGLAITGAIVGELLGAEQGLGVLISQAQGSFSPDGVYAGLVITSIVALVAEGLITAAERYLLRWRPPRRVAGSDS
jgi:NitT/TauT family transport system permease protein